MFEQVASGKIKAIWIMATNPVASLPQSEQVKQALKACPLVIVSDAFDTSETCQYADVLLPACGWGEKSGTVTNSERRISRQRSFKTAYGESKADWWIICQVAKAMGFGKAFDYDNEAQIFAEHAQLSAQAAKLTQSFDISGLTELDEAGYQRMPPMQWPQKQSQLFELHDIRLFADGRFFTANGRPNMVPVYDQRANLINNNPTHGKLAPLVLNSGRNRDQWHTLTRSGVAEQLNLHAHEPELLLHPQDAKSRDLTDGAIVSMGNEQGRMLIRLKCSDKLKPGEAFVPMHYSGEFYSQGSINRLVRPLVDSISKQPAFKSSSVSVRATSMCSEAMVLTRQQLKVSALPDYWVYHRVTGGYLYYLADEIEPALLVEKLSALLQSNTQQVNRLDGGDGGDGGQQRLTRTAMVDGQVSWSIQASAQVGMLDPSWLVDAFSQPLDGQLKCALLSGKAFGERDKGKMLCLCMKVGSKQIKQAVAEQNQPCVKSIGEQTGAGTGCGSCISDIALLVDGGLLEQA
jgi:assimilatory nitrate reductase catalytic subunit